MGHATDPEPVRAYENLPREHGLEPLRVEGELPEDLRGTLYRNGPGLRSLFDQPYRHWFDGDGAITAVRFDGGQALGGVRLVQSDGLIRERRAGKLLYAGYDTPTAPWRMLGAALRLLPHSQAMKNVANTSVLAWQGRLLALWEGGLPTEVDPSTLETLGERDLDGAIVATFSAHPHRVPRRRARYNFGVRYGPRTFLDLYELPDEGAARCLGSLKLSAPSMIHDFAVTENHLVFFVPPLKLRMLRFICGLGSYAENLEWEPQLGTEVIVVPIDQPDRVTRFRTDPFFQWHFANAFERSTRGGSRTGEVVIDFVRHPDFQVHERIQRIAGGRERPPPEVSLYRASLDHSTRRISFESRYTEPCEFPQVHPSFAGDGYRFVWTAGYRDAQTAQVRPWTHLARIDIERGDARFADFGPGRYPSEPVFVPRPGGRDEDDGYLLTLVYDAHEHASHVAVLDARRLEDGPLARAWFDHHIPPTLHGTWADAGETRPHAAKASPRA